MFKMPDRFKVTKTDAPEIDATYNSILKDEDDAVLGKLLPPSSHNDSCEKKGKSIFSRILPQFLSSIHFFRFFIWFSRIFAAYEQYWNIDFATNLYAQNQLTLMWNGTYFKRIPIQKKRTETEKIFTDHIEFFFVICSRRQKNEQKIEIIKATWIHLFTLSQQYNSSSVKICWYQCSCIFRLHSEGRFVCKINNILV